MNRNRNRPGRIDVGRRRLFRSISAGVLGYGLADLLAMEPEAPAASSLGKARNVLVIYEEGGTSQTRFQQ